MVVLRSGSPYWLLSAALFGLAIGVPFGAILLAIDLRIVAVTTALVLVLFAWMTLKAHREDKKDD